MRGFLLLTLLVAGLQTPAQPGFTVRGVVRAEGTPEGIPNVQVTLVAGTVVRSMVTTDNGGAFSFVDVPAGNYRIDAERAGYFSPVRSADGSFVTKISATVTVVTAQPPNLQLSLVPGGAITGRVVDSNGRPVPGLSVAAYSKYYDTDGQQQLTQSRYALQRRTSNDRGEYRYFDLPPGEYFVAASSEGPAMYTRTFHPGVDPSSALAVLVVPTGEAQADIRMQHQEASKFREESSTQFPTCLPYVEPRRHSR